jgi:hypothetical protein
MRKVISTAVLATLVIFSAEASASAGTCADETPVLQAPKANLPQSTQERRAGVLAAGLTRATIVVRAKVAEVHAGNDAFYPKAAPFGHEMVSGANISARAVEAKFVVTEAVKGNTPATVRLYTGFGA